MRIRVEENNTSLDDNLISNKNIIDIFGTTKIDKTREI